MDKDRPAPSRVAPVGPDFPGGLDPSASGKPGRPAEAARTAAEPEFLAGRILIAMPGIGDERFERTVILICVHDDEQAMGLVLNRPIEGLDVPGLLRKLGLPADGAPEAAVLYGGPVERMRGYVLHTDDWTSPGSTVAVTASVGMTDTREVLDALGDREHRPRQALLALGYAGWGAGQLEHELRQGVWLACDPDETLLFGPDHDAKWTQALAKIGVTPDRLSAQAGRA